MTDNGSVRHLAPAAPPADDWDEDERTDPGDPVAESERAVLGSMILSGDKGAGRMADPDAVADATAILQPEHFAAPAHRRNGASARAAAAL